MALFSLDEIRKEPAAKATGSLILKERFLNEHLVKVESIKQLIHHVPDPGELFCIWTLNSFNAFTFIPFMIKEHGKIEELIISTYSISSRILDAITKFIEKGKLCQIHITISDSIKFRTPRVQEQLEILSRIYPVFTVQYAWNHSKVTLIRTQEGKFVVEGSGNYSENAQFEQYMFLNSDSIYEFRKSCIKSAQNGI